MSFGSRSLPPPTPEEAERIVRAKIFGCVACFLKGFTRRPPAQYNHCLIGGLRAGHRFGWPACDFHHNGNAPLYTTPRDYARERGPSLRHGSKLFHDAFGSDQHLQNVIDDALGYPRVVIARVRRGKNTATPKKCVARCA